MSLSESWQGLSQRPGRRRARAGLLTRISRPWRVAAGCLVCAAALYGLAEGGYASRSAGYAVKSLSMLMVRAGFAANRVTVEGQNRTGDEEIVEALGIGRNTSTLAFDTDAAQERLEKLPLVRNAQVMRLLPSQLHVVIEERVPYAVWQHKSKLYLVDQDGTVIDTLKAQPHPGLPLVVGEGAAEHARALLDELAHWPQVKEKVQAAIRVADRRWNLKLVTGLEIRLPENDAARALKKVAELDSTHGILSGDAVFVDLRLADRVTIRLNESGEPRRGSALAAPARRYVRQGQDT